MRKLSIEFNETDLQNTSLINDQDLDEEIL